MGEGPSKAEWLEPLLARIRHARVGVFGDFCLDAYWQLDAEEGERSVETHLPVHRVRRQRYGLGGAGNIVANLAALGAGGIEACGIVGDDLFGRELLGLLGELNVDCCGVLTSQADWQTLVYAKPHLGDREQSRVDFGAFNALSAESAESLAAHLKRAATECGVMILNQQVPGGTASPAMIAQINAVVAGHPDRVFIADSRHRSELFTGCLLKLNAHEALRVLSRSFRLDEAVPVEIAKAAAGQLEAQIGRTVFVTLGAEGVVVADGGAVHVVAAISGAGPTDPVGAGDTFVAAVAAAMASGADPLTAARLGNLAAAVTARKLRTTGTATPEEIRRAAES